MVILVKASVAYFNCMKQNLTDVSLDPLLRYFNGLMPLDETEKGLVESTFHPRLYRRRQYVHQDGNICTHLNFVVRGCLRMYKVDDRGTTRIVQFAPENRWINDLGSFHSKKASTLNIDALEDTLVLQISYEDLISLYTRAPKFDRIFRVLIEDSFVNLQQRFLETISSIAEDRYLSFLEVYPELSNRLPQTQIASYLGITPEFLSRLRNKRGAKS